MSNSAIVAENLSKSYSINRSKDRHRYNTLQEDIHQYAHRFRTLFTRKREHLDSRVETFWALDNVSFKANQGEVLGIIGRNGAGKSTLLKVLSRITDPTRGRADLFGRVGTLLEVGTGFHPELTGRENIYLSGAILGMRSIEITKRFNEIVEFAEVERFVDTPVKRYSSGMYMRLAFAVAAHLDTEILLVDEVLAVGDVDFQRKCLGKMNDVKGEGRTVLFVSHNMNAVEQLCQQVLLLENGKVIEQSRNIRTLVQRYLSVERAQSSSEWINDGNTYNNPWFTPTRFRIVDVEGQPVPMPFRNDSDVWLQIEAEVREVDSALTIGYALYTDVGQLMYWSYQTDGPTNTWPKLKTGICTLQSKIPQRLLNEGTYRLELIGGLHFRQWLFEPEVGAPSITLVVQGGLSDSPYWMQKRPGALAPVLNWDLLG